MCIGLYELWKTGRYKSYPPSVLVDLIARVLALVPPWTRIYRVQRYVSLIKLFIALGLKMIGILTAPPPIYNQILSPVSGSSQRPPMRDQAVETGRNYLTEITRKHTVNLMPARHFIMSSQLFFLMPKIAHFN